MDDSDTRLDENHCPVPAGESIPQPVVVAQRMTADQKMQPLQHIPPKNNLFIVFTGLMACVFLAGLDQTIVATALPTIVAQLEGGKDYSWVGT
ncbi:hypothetical protein K466DRAFT_607158 [Polyporus arcularius HHB13444]|uniref:Major facilitator superfamily (MFS) profile domain-containing protein n=1 Tax=Polyporus arcularius HHB13444 TaxID=1314778 RepID=A0A5C3NNM8_9APHY|nr:hypothetical protein K466DRAFT_607158 [Polyporus arcularius HHB13444]